MSSLSVTEARDQLPAVIAAAQEKPVRISRHGKDVAVIIEPSLYESLLEAQEELEDIAAFDAAMGDKSPDIPWAQVQQDLNLV